MFEVNSEKTLAALYSQTTFFEYVTYGSPAWDKLTVEEDVDNEAGWRSLGVNIQVPECSAFGDTLIQLAGKYENHGEDCLFIQELVAAYMAGKLRYIDQADSPIEG